MSDETSGTPSVGDETPEELAGVEEAPEMKYPEGEPDESWKKGELAQYMADNSITAVNGLGSTKAEMLGAILGSRINQPDVGKWDDPKVTITPGARGAVVAQIRRRLGLDDGGDKFDARMKVRVVRFQRWSGLPATGLIDPVTRSRLT